MKRPSLIGMVMLIAMLAMAISACSPSPKSRADDFTAYLPEEVGGWELDETVKLLGSTVSNEGHAILTYEGEDDAIAYIVVRALASEDAARVVLTNRVRELQLMGLAMDRDRAPGQATAEIAQTERVRYALFGEGDLFVEVNALSAEGEDPISDESFGVLLEIVRSALEKMVE